jgi:hypothetical protein
MRVKLGLRILREERRLKAFENRVLRRIFEAVWDKVIGLRKFYNKELHNLYSLPNIFRMMKLRRKSWVWHVARMRERRNAYRKQKDHCENQDVGGK